MPTAISVAISLIVLVVFLRYVGRRLFKVGRSLGENMRRARAASGATRRPRHAAHRRRNKGG
jgi:hypothetical protein